MLKRAKQKTNPEVHPGYLKNIEEDFCIWTKVTSGIRSPDDVIGTGMSHYDDVIQLLDSIRFDLIREILETKNKNQFLFQLFFSEAKKILVDQLPQLQHNYEYDDSLMTHYE